MEIRFNGVNAFHQMGSWNVLVLAFSLFTSLAVAKEGQQVPKTTPAATTPGALPAGPPAAGVGAAQGKGSAWVKLCSKNEQTGNKQLCLVKYEELDPNTGLRQIIVAAMNMQQKAMAFPVPLTGFGKTFDGPPVDNAKYEEARRLMMEKFRQRQIELANKAAEAQQKKEQGGGQAQAEGGAPGATVAPPKTAPAAPPQ